MAEVVDLRSRAVLPIGTVMTLTALSARQIRYYEKQGLVHPQRTAGNHRMYALNDVDALIDIKDQLASGLSLDDIKRLRKPRQPVNETSDAAVRQALRAELLNQSRMNQNPSGPSVSQGFGFRP
ncbi:MerR family transcriptional regulator [Lacticaseibacillus yichunensis]|uniref:MerR family transcriptional regulator n=1 Tax=Lacticaseibacillus yichunensis TaxID=2486015 RepID=A0ABW4CPA4_9LACO|nr:MerR family transcriptional regulator [Lacticaseibacillus yichunensis]